MRTSIRELINVLSDIDNDDTTIEWNFQIMEKCPVCNSDKNVISCSGYGWFCNSCATSFGRD